MEDIVEYVAIVMLTVVFSVMYVFLMGTVYPKFVLKPNYSVKSSTDRGIRKVRYDGGRGVVYEPIPAFRKYVPLYALYTGSGYKYFKCKVDPFVTAMTYEIILFSSKNKVIDMLSVKETVTGGTTIPVLLHQDTSYVSLVIHTVNGTAIDNRRVAHIKGSSAVMFILLSTITTSLIGIVLRAFYSATLNTFNEGFGSLASSWINMIPVGTVGFIYAMLVISKMGRKGLRVKFK